MHVEDVHRNPQNASAQGLTHVNISAQGKRFVRHRGCVWGLFRDVRECKGVLAGA
jgi:hypothetical protein